MLRGYGYYSIFEVELLYYKNYYKFISLLDNVELIIQLKLTKFDDEVILKNFLFLELLTNQKPQINYFVFPYSTNISIQIKVTLLKRKIIFRFFESYFLILLSQIYGKPILLSSIIKKESELIINLNNINLLKNNSNQETKLSVSFFIKLKGNTSFELINFLKGFNFLN